MFSVREAFRTGWRYLNENAGFLVGVHVVAIFVQLAPQILLGDSPETRGFGAIAGTLLSFVVALGLFRIGLGIVDGESVGYSELFSCAHLVFKYLIASILYAVIVITGLLLLLVPGAIWSAQFSQWPYLMVEHEMGPIEALKESSRITRGAKGRLILFFIGAIILMLLGFLAIIVGAVVAYAVITVAGAYVYRQILANQPDAGEGAA
jgi:uncharacterized membrane protein